MKKKNCDWIFNIFQILLQQYIRSLVLNCQAFLPNKYNFIDIHRKQKLKNLETENVLK